MDWKCSYWYPDDPHAAYGPPPPAPGPNRSQRASGEDWWDDHKNSYASSKLAGYIAAGYSKFVGWAATEQDGNPTGCLLTQLPSPRCSELETENNVDGSIVATMALMDLTGRVVWSNAYQVGFFNRVIQTSDGGYLAVGKSYSTLTSAGTPLVYNPGQPAGCVAGSPPAAGNSFSQGHGCPIGGGSHPHVMLVKTDHAGAVEWEYLYGMQPYDGSDPEDAFNTEAEGWDLVEAEDGGFVVVGRADDPSTSFLCGVSGSPGPSVFGRGFVFDVDRHGQWRWGAFVPLSTPSYVTGITRLQAPGPSPSYVISGFYTRAQDCDTRVFAMRIFEPLPAPAPPCPALPVAWSRLYVEQNGTGQNTYGVQVATRPGAPILLPAIVGKGDGNHAMVYLLDGGTGAPFSGAGDNPVDLGRAKANDLRVLVVPTSDGGFGASTTFAGNPLQKLTPPCSDLAPPDDWNTDAHVAKYDSSNKLAWQWTFDFGGAPGKYPDDQRKEECIFAISDDENGGFVVSGRDSYNFDDGYMAHVLPPIEVSPFPLFPLPLPPFFP